MTAWEWLASPDGHAFAYTVIALMNAVIVAISLRNNREIKKQQTLLNGHLARHERDAASREPPPC